MRPELSEIISPARVGAIAQNTFREAVRNRVFIGLLVSAVAFIGCSMVLAELSVVGEGPRVVLDFGFFAISLFCVVTAIVMGAVLLHKEVEKKTIFTIVSKPVQRYEVVLGKYFGLWGILLVEVVGLALVWFLVLSVQGVPITAELVKGLTLVFFEVGLVTAAAVMFSAISSPVMTALFTAGLFAVGRVVYVVAEMLGQTKGFFTKNPGLRPFGEAVTATFPDLSVFNTSQQVLMGVETPWAYVGHSFAYGLAYGAIFLALAVLAFQRRDFV